MTNVTAVTIDNVSPERTGLYIRRSDVETYLMELWPDVPLKDFQIAQGEDRMTFVAPRELLEADWKVIIRRARKRKRTNSSGGA